MQNYKTYKIISLTRQQPIFICKAIPVKQQSNFNQPLQHISNHEKPNFFALRQRISQVADKLIKSRQSNEKSNNCSRRSFSFQLPKQGKLEQDAREIEEKKKKQKSIKEYLKLVYNRAERERRSNSYRLPSLKKDESQEKAETQNVQRQNYRSSNDLKDVSSMKQKMRNMRSRLKLSQEQNYFSGKYSFRMDKLTGWEEKQEEELAFAS